MHGFKLKENGVVWSLICFYPENTKSPEYRYKTRSVPDGKVITIYLGDKYDFELFISQADHSPALRFDGEELVSNVTYQFDGIDRIKANDEKFQYKVVELEVFRHDGIYPEEAVYMNGDLHGLDKAPENSDIPENVKLKPEFVFEEPIEVAPVYINLAVVGRWLREDRDGYSRTEVLLKHLCGAEAPTSMEMALVQSALTSYRRGLVELNPITWKRVEMPCTNYTALMRAVVAEAEPWMTNQAMALRPLLTYFDQTQHPYGDAWRFRHSLLRGTVSLKEGMEGSRFGDSDDPHRMVFFNVGMETVVVYGGEAFVINRNQASMIGEVYGGLFGLQGLIGAI